MLSNVTGGRLASSKMSASAGDVAVPSVRTPSPVIVTFDASDIPADPARPIAWSCGIRSLSSAVS